MSNPSDEPTANVPFEDRISQDRLNFLALEVEEQGGTLLAKTCFQPALAMLGGENVKASASPHSCSKASLFAVAYDVEAEGKFGRDEQIARGAGLATVCGSGDRMDLWPKFIKGAQEYK